MPLETANAFSQIATATDEVFQELRRMNRRELVSHGVLGFVYEPIREPFKVTARNKQGFGENTVVEVSLEGKFPQVWKIPNEKRRLDENLEIGGQLLDATAEYQVPETAFRVPTTYPEDGLREVRGSLRQGVPASHVLHFLRNFNYPPGISAEMNPRLIADFVAEEDNYTHFDLYVPTLPNFIGWKSTDEYFRSLRARIRDNIWSRTFKPCTDPEGFRVSTKSNILPPKATGTWKRLVLI